MAPVNRDQAIWRARGGELGTLLLRLLRALHAGAGQLRGIGPGRRKLPRTP